MVNTKDIRKGRGRLKSVERGQAVERATDLYWREGCHTLSLNEVCQRISISKPALYREFGGEDGLVEAVLAHYRDIVVNPVLEFLTAEQPFAETLEALIVGMTAPRPFPPGCLFTEMRMIRQQLGAQSLTLLEEMEAERRDAFTRWYARAIDKGEVNASITSDEAGQFIDAQFTLILLHMGMERDAKSVQFEARLALSGLTQRSV